MKAFLGMVDFSMELRITLYRNYATGKLLKLNFTREEMLN